MVRAVTYQDIVDAGALQLVDVMSEDEHARLHLPGAMNIPLTLLDRNTTEWLDQSRPVAVYCWDAY